jgi:peptidyl-prolyl cis-trans isomerase-like 4
MTAEDQEKRKKELEKQQSRSRAQILVELGDIPDADIKPPDDVLFVCRLNPVTSEDDLKIIFGRFGNIDDCEIIRDKLTGDSLCYAFIKYDTEESAIEAYFKMNKVLIDERRIHVDFSQSVAKVDWQNSRKLLKAGGGKPFEKKERNNNNNNNRNDLRTRDLRDEVSDKKRKREFDRDEKPVKEESRDRNSYRDRDRDSNHIKSEYSDRREERPKYAKEESRDRESYRDRDRDQRPKYAKEESRDRESYRDRDNRDSTYIKEENRDRYRDGDRDSKYVKEENRDRGRSDRKYEDKYDDRKRY